MLAFPASRKAVFLSIGLVEALASLLGFLGAANLPGVVLPLLAQSILVWQVLLAVFVLKKRLGAAQYVGVSLVGAGVCLAAWPGGGGGASPLDGVNPFYALIFMGSMLFPVSAAAAGSQPTETWPALCWASGRAALVASSELVCPPAAPALPPMHPFLPARLPPSVRRPSTRS